MVSHTVRQDPSERCSTLMVTTKSQKLQLYLINSFTKCSFFLVLKWGMSDGRLMLNSHLEFNNNINKSDILLSYQNADNIEGLK